MTCVVCGQGLRKLGLREASLYAVCPECHAIQLQPMPTSEELDELYRAEYSSVGHYHQSAASHREARHRVCEQIAQCVVSLHASDDPRMVVDFGAGWGTLASVLMDHGVPTVGFEPSESMAAAAAELGLPVHLGGLEVLEADSELSGNIRTVVMMAVYEHLPEQEQTLRRLAGLLPDDGAIVIQSPTAGIPRVLSPFLKPFGSLPSFFGTLAPPWHVCVPSPRSVRLQANRCGLEVISIVPSLSGRDRGWKRSLQGINEGVARLGHAILGERWPLAMGHLFVLRSAP